MMLYNIFIMKKSHFIARQFCDNISILHWCFVHNCFRYVLLPYDHKSQFSRGYCLLCLSSELPVWYSRMGCRKLFCRKSCLQKSSIIGRWAYLIYDGYCPIGCVKSKNYQYLQSYHAFSSLGKSDFKNDNIIYMWKNSVFWTTLKSWNQGYKKDQIFLGLQYIFDKIVEIILQEKK